MTDGPPPSGGSSDGQRASTPPESTDGDLGDTHPDSSCHSREQRLVKDNERLEGLVAAISHDLRTPLTVAEGNAQLARETGDLSRLDATQRALDRATERLDHLETLVKDGRQITDPEPVDLREVTEAAWELIGTEDAALTVEASRKLAADRQRLQELLENLLGNAIEHAGVDVTITVGLLDGGFYIEDDGPGVPEAERADVFKMGYSSNAESSGFGLALCRHIAEAHGWTIEVAEGIDGGARVEVTDISGR